MTPEAKADLVEAMHAEAYSIYIAVHAAWKLAELATASAQQAWEMAKRQNRDLHHKADDLEASK